MTTILDDERPMKDWTTRRIAEEACRVYRSDSRADREYGYELHDELNRRGHYWSMKFLPDDETFMETCLADAETME